MTPLIRPFGCTAALAIGAGAVLIATAATATAEAGPGCTTGDVTAVMTGVSASMTTYLFTHPDVNEFFTSLQGKKKADAAEQTRAYLAANPQIRDELGAIRAPALELRNRCNIPLKAEIAGVL